MEADSSPETPTVTGVSLIAAERLRQAVKENYTDTHDDGHNASELILAAICYCEHDALGLNQGRVPDSWPWENAAWKPKDRIRNLVRAGALIAAEIDRLRRLEK